ncbi:spore germination protein [Gracilibacillus marinus]|uniref:Spore germination protein n=1 Tax=Gracilibacillus marinus TaxID=630535 RepID=A0ABV8VRG0_9BACI
MKWKKRTVSSGQKQTTSNAYGNVHFSVQENKEKLEEIFHQSSDIKSREFLIPTASPVLATLIFVDGMVSEENINLQVMTPLLKINSEKINDMFSYIQNEVLTTSNLKIVDTFDEAVKGILAGLTALIVDHCNQMILVNTIQFETRSVEEPDTESTVRGSREGFNEVLTTNTSLIRRRINHQDLLFEDFTIGKLTQTTVRIGYMHNVASQEVVAEVRRRLNHIDTDSILESGYIEQFIEDHPNSIFSTVANSEKADKVCAKILEGRVAILCNNTPFVLTVPHLFVESLQVPEDYYSNKFIASFVRILRLIALFLTLFTPGIFVAASTFHQEMVPTLLLTTMAAAEEKVPFPILLEAILMIFIFQLLREAGVRMPRPIGSAISIVGALVIGESAVQAGLVGAPMVIVVALTAITGFVVTALSNTIVILRFFLLILGGTLGLYGLLLGALIIIAHACSLKSFGVPYMTPIAPIIISEWKDYPLRLSSSLYHHPRSLVKSLARYRGRG